MVDRNRTSIEGDDLAEEEEIPLTVLLLSKQGSGDGAGRIVNATEKAETRTTIAEPGMRTAIDLNQHAFLRIPLSSRAMRGNSMGPGTGDPLLLEDAAYRGTGETDVLSFGQEIGQMMLITAGIPVPCQGTHLLACCCSNGMGGTPSAVSMSHGCYALRAIRSHQSSYVPE
jgi:hypothetical protein